MGSGGTASRGGVSVVMVVVEVEVVVVVEEEEEEESGDGERAETLMAEERKELGRSASASRSARRARCVASSSRGLPGSGGLSVRRSASAASMSGLTSGGGVSWKATLGAGVMPLMISRAF